MKPFLKNYCRFVITLSLSTLLITPVVFAQEETLTTTSAGTPIQCDQDGDGYIAIPQAAVGLMLDKSFNPNGNYSKAEWLNAYNKIKSDKDGAMLCLALNFKKGAEPSRCDSPIISAESGLFDPAKVSSVTGSQLNPDAFDVPDNGIDENCDGSDGKLVTNVGQEKDLGTLGSKALTWLSRAVAGISIIILIIGGLMYATAAGDEQKVARARKAMIGAIIGLIVGLLAPTIVSTITASLG